ncbi:hypothetical protein DM01DRAFT_1336853 [Hesseltinella vesiculosa]|uniref:Uncharacterized protein n=1 Tax=Hesseltinella vesiculosa TaxID=101127 RepID=A0A1X2GFF4_9FUNG|nr:hypothetical protein DM01DRAFT_1336853 [Hesseltinella vesiculosa]
METLQHIPGFEILSLTSVDPEPDDCADHDMVEWIDDCEVQENLFQFIPLVPEEAHCDKDNHIVQEIRVFFEDLGYLCEEPDQIDPTADYEAEFQQRSDQQKQSWAPRRKQRRRQQHIDLVDSTCSSIKNPSLEQTCPQSMDIASPGLSSSTSSFHHTDDDHDDDVRSPHYLGRAHAVQPSHHHPHPYQHHPYHFIHHLHHSSHSVPKPPQPNHHHHHAPSPLIR